MNYIYCN